MIEVNLIPTLFAVAARAIELAEAEKARKWKSNDLATAYNDYREQTGVELIQRDTSHWELMLKSAEKEYTALQRAKRAEYNAKRRLQTAIRAYEHGAKLVE